VKPAVATATRMKHRWLVGLTVLLLVGVLAPGGTVAAHASLLESTPAANDILDISPTDIVLRFTEPVDPVDESIRLVSAAGEPVALGAIRQDLGDDTLAVSIDVELDDGSYVVAWAAVSEDSHPISGAFGFSVGAPSEDPPAIAAESSDQSSRDGGWLLAAGRLGSYAGSLVVIGTAALVAGLAPERLASRRTATVLAAAGGVAVLGTVAMLAGQSRVINGTYLDWTTVVGTHAGRWWGLRLILLIACTLAIPDLGRLRHPFARVVGVALAVGLLLVVALGGHAVSGVNTRAALLSTVVHLGAAATWIGGLILLAVVAEPDTRWPLARRFSTIALASVVVLGASGTVNGLRQLDRPADLLDTTYGKWLVAKLALVGVVLAVAAVSRSTVRRAGRGPDNPAPSDQRNSAPAVTDDRLRRTVMLELGGISLVIAATVALGSAIPPRALAATSKQPAIVVASDSQDALTATVELRPATTGGTTMTVQIEGVTGDPADDIVVTAELASESLGPLEIPTQPAGDNAVATTDADFPVAGTWTITITARFGEFDQVVFELDTPVVGR